MATNIKCPNCATVFDVENVLSADVEQKLKQRYEKQLQESLSQINSDKKKLEEDQKAFEEKKKRENELFQQKLQQEKLKLESELQQQLRKSIASDYENQLRLLKQSAEENEEKLKTARQKELEFLKKEQEIKNKEQELEIILQKKLLQEMSEVFRHLLNSDIIFFLFQLYGRMVLLFILLPITMLLHLVTISTTWNYLKATVQMRVL